VPEWLERLLGEISAAEWVAVAFAFAYLLLAIRQNAWCWFTSIVSSAIFLVIFARSGLPMQAWLQGFYIAMAVYGWRAWGRGVDQRGELPVSRRPLAWHAVAIALVCAVGLVNGAWAARSAPGGVVPYLDSLTAWASVFTTWLVARKVLENWLYWIVIDLAAAVLYWSQGLALTALLFVAYALLAVRGYQEWQADLDRRTASHAGDGLA
jgi:nicotinamide mononucleotide transporter